MNCCGDQLNTQFLLLPLIHLKLHFLLYFYYIWYLSYIRPFHKHISYITYQFHWIPYFLKCHCHKINISNLQQSSQSYSISSKNLLLVLKTQVLRYHQIVSFGESYSSKQKEPKYRAACMLCTLRFLFYLFSVISSQLFLLSYFFSLCISTFKHQYNILRTTKHQL